MTQQEAPAGLAPAELYPIQRVRFRGGRVFHRTKEPTEWHDLLEAACGRTGYLATGYPGRRPGQCPGCEKATTDVPAPPAGARPAS